MEVTFKYKGTIISTPNLEKKLKRMKLSIDDVEIINEEKPIPEKQIIEDTKKYYYVNSKGETIVSIYDNLDNLKGIINTDEYERRTTNNV